MGVKWLIFLYEPMFLPCKWLVRDPWESVACNKTTACHHLPKKQNEDNNKPNMDRVRSQSTTFDKATLNPPLVLFKPTKLSKVFIVERGGKNSYLKEYLRHKS